MISATSIVNRDGYLYAVDRDGRARSVEPTGTHRNDAGHDDPATGYPVYRETIGERIDPTNAEMAAAFPGILDA